jgi:hypothetical protein
MAFISLSQRDVNVLGKIKDPESDPAVAQSIDPTLPRDPHVADQTQYESVSRREQQIVRDIQQLEMQLAGLHPRTVVHPIEEYRTCIEHLGGLIHEQPDYASARNNRAQALRRLFGDMMLVEGNASTAGQQALVSLASNEMKAHAAGLAISDLNEAIALLTPAPYTPMSPQAAKTLSMAHTQRAALFHTTAKALSRDPDRRVLLSAARPESGWGKLEFEEAASRDFALGGRYGNEIAKGLAVATNPTAKLCGQMVREAMKKEYGEEYAA